MARPQPMRPALILALALVATSTASTRTQAPPTGILIKGGTVIDGTGAPRRSADVRISGDTIVEVGPNLTAKPGDAVIDAAGRVVTPGFIDMHSHADRGLEDLRTPRARSGRASRCRSSGQDGGGDLPVSDFFER